jgi:hypothetical protein
MIAELAVMGDVAIGHNQVMIAHDGDADIGHRCPVDGDEFPDGVMIADNDPRFLSLILQVLGGGADRRKLKDMTILADIRMAFDYYMGTNLCLFADGDTRADDAVWTDLDVFGNFGVG